MALGDRGMPVAVGDHLALLGHPEPAVDRARGWARIAWLAGPPPRPTAPPRPWKNWIVIPCAAAGLDQLALGPVQGPGRLEEAALLVAVGVADHDFLDVAPQLEVAAVDGQRRRAAP